MKKYLITDATTEQLSLDEVKDHLRVIGTDEDVYLQALIAATRKLAEVQTSQRYGEQTVKLTFAREDYMDRYIELEHPATEITSCKYTLDEVETAITEYSFRDDYLILDNNIDYDTLEIEHKCGKMAPQSVKSGMLLLIGHLYENREATTDLELRQLPFGINHLFGTDKVTL